MPQDVCPLCGQVGGEYAEEFGCCAYCEPFDCEDDEFAEEDEDLDSVSEWHDYMPADDEPEDLLMVGYDDEGEPVFVDLHGDSDVPF